MNSQKEAREGEISTEELNDLIIDSIQDIKGKNIVKLDLRHLEEAPAEYFIICEGESNVQVKSISDNIYKRVKNEGNMLATHIEGQQTAQWVLVDYFNVVVHVFYKEAREFYGLDDLWGDAIFTEYQNL